jgi:DNA-binding transcriptional LysR family regulator
MAANEFTALYLLPVLAEFRRLHPMIRITVRRSLGSTIPDDVLKHNVEIGVLSYDPQEPQLKSAVVYLDELVFVVPPGCAGVGGGSASVSWGRSFVAHRKPPYRDKVIEAFRQHRPLCTWTSSCYAASHQALVSMGNSVKQVPRSAENEITRGELVRIPVRELHFQRKLRLHRRSPLFRRTRP